MIGYASDIGAYNFESRTGAEQGPASFREIAGIMSMPADNAYYKVDTSQAKLKIFDCGDIKSDGLNLEPV
jgi:arginase family enzyme